MDVMMERTYWGSDVVTAEFLRFPLTLLANPKYREISLEAKFIYTLLLNRLTLSQRNGWVNEENEVYLIYTREEAANTLNISYRKAIAAFKELIAVELLFEQRQGRGYPNLLYVLKTELTDTDAKALEEIYARYEFHLFQPHIQTMFRSVIERMYYSDPLKIGNALLPQEKVRSYLHLLDCDVLLAALESMKQNKERVRNPTAYLMSVLFNGICEQDSNLILHLPPEYQGPEDFFSG